MYYSCLSSTQAMEITSFCCYLGILKWKFTRKGLYVHTSWIPNSRQVYHLLHAMYGLRQASHAWYSCIDQFFLSFGLIQSSEDPNLYFSIKNNKYVIIILYVHNIIMTNDDFVSLNHLQQQMMKTFCMTNLGDAECYLEVEILQTPQGIFFHQSGYIHKLLDWFGMSDCTSLSTPMNLHTKLSKDMSSTPIDRKLYQSLVATLLHVKITRFDIQFAISYVSHYLTNLQMSHLIVAKNILRYLKGIQNYGLFYSTLDTGNLTTYTNVDWRAIVTIANQPLIYCTNSERLRSVGQANSKWR